MSPKMRLRVLSRHNRGAPLRYKFPSQDTPQVYQAPRPLLFLGGWRDIAEAYGVPMSHVHKWYDLGAPIAISKNTPIAEAWELWCWLKEEFG